MTLELNDNLQKNLSTIQPYVGGAMSIAGLYMVLKDKLDRQRQEIAQSKYKKVVEYPSNTTRVARVG